MRAAIIGCGRGGPGRGGAHSIGYAHARAMVRPENEIQLAGVSSLTEKELATFCEEYGSARGYLDYREMLASEKPELVSICAFPPDRENMVMAALDADVKLIWVEKPFALSLGAAQRMIEAAEKKGARLFVNFQRRYGKPFEWVKEAVQAGRIGTLYGAQIVQPNVPLIDFGPHLLDAVVDVLEIPARRQVVKVLGAAAPSDKFYQGVPIESQFVGTAHLSDGTRIVVESGIHHAARAPIIRYDGDQGFAEMLISAPEGEKSVVRGRFKGEAGLSVLNVEENFHHGAVDANLYMDRALADMLQAFRTGAPSRLDARAVLPGLEILLSLFDSARRGEAVDFPPARHDSPF